MKIDLFQRVLKSNFTIVMSRKDKYDYMIIFSPSQYLMDY